MGKYIRHGIGVLAAAIVATILPLLGLEPAMLTEAQAEQVALLTAALETVLYVFVSLVTYPLVEKFLKRFPLIDTEGWIDRLWLKSEAKDPSAETRQLQGRRL